MDCLEHCMQALNKQKHFYQTWNLCLETHPVLVSVWQTCITSTINGKFNWNVNERANRFPPAQCAQPWAGTSTDCKKLFQSLWRLLPRMTLLGSAVIVSVSIEILQQEFEVLLGVKKNQENQGMHSYIGMSYASRTAFLNHWYTENSSQLYLEHWFHSCAVKVRQWLYTTAPLLAERLRQFIKLG